MSRSTYLLAVLCLQVDPDFDWAEFYGEGGVDFVKTSRAYRYDTMHPFLTQQFIGDYFMCHGAAAGPLIFRFCDYEGTLEHLERSLRNIRRAMESPNQQPEYLSLIRGLPSWSLIANVAGLPEERRNEIASVMVEYSLTWTGADAKVDASLHPFIRERGGSAGFHIYSAEQLAWIAKVRPA